MTPLYLVENRIFTSRETADKFWRIRNTMHALDGNHRNFPPIQVITADFLSKEYVNTKYEKYKKYGVERKAPLYEYIDG